MAARDFGDAIALLEADHRRIEALLARFENSGCDGRREVIARQICAEIKAHMTIEEEIFYPALRGRIEDRLLDAAHVEHVGVKVLVRDIEASAPDEDYYDAKLKMLSDEIAHHVKAAEWPTDGIFAQCLEADVDLAELLDRMVARKEALLAPAESRQPDLVRKPAVALPQARDQVQREPTES